MLGITEQVNQLAERIHSLRSDDQRLIVAICGAPGSGKSTLAEQCARRLIAQKCATETLPMDGFHLDNQILEARGLLPRKGAPQTFDAAGFVTLIHRLKRGDHVFFPSFDRDRDIAIAGAGEISPQTPVVLVEGNYLLFDQSPWNALAPMWDLTVRLHVPAPELRARLIHRWLSQGFSRAAATRRAEQNDLANAALIDTHALPADMVL